MNALPSGENIKLFEMYKEYKKNKESKESKKNYETLKEIIINNTNGNS